MTTHAFRHQARERLSDRERAKLFLDRDGRCHRCTRKITPGEKWSDEHLIALECGGSNAWDNRVLTCGWCKPIKDGEDHSRAAKGKRLAIAHAIPRSQRSKKSRPMPGSKNSAYKHKMNGRWERR